MVLCGLGMQQYAMHNATIQKTTFSELGVYCLLLSCYCYYHYYFIIHMLVWRIYLDACFSEIYSSCIKPANVQTNWCLSVVCLLVRLIIEYANPSLIGFNNTIK